MPRAMLGADGIAHKPLFGALRIDMASHKGSPTATNTTGAASRPLALAR